jgi:hypothetical protein
MRFKNLESYRIGGVGNDMQLEILLPKMPDGRVYRYSPNENAHPRFFLLGDRVEGFALPETRSARMSHMPGTPGMAPVPISRSLNGMSLDWISRTAIASSGKGE